MKTADFLLEIGVEELPADQILPAIGFIEQSFEKLLQEQRLSFKGICKYSTPRRLAVLISDLQTAQEDLERIITGPSTRIAYTPEGTLSPAAQGFLKKNRAQEIDVYMETTEKGEFIAIRQLEKGKSAEEILGNKVPEILAAIPFAKRMIWKDPHLSFSRPIRWILAMLDDTVLPIELFGIQSDRCSRGLRFCDEQQNMCLGTASEYEKMLQSCGIIADRDARKDNIRKSLQDISNSGTYRVLIDERLLDTVTDMVERPSAVIAEFEEHFLMLPAKIITSTISQNQKYFAMEHADGSGLCNKFVFISNGDPSYNELIRRGNEKVVKPRLADAMWYYHEDTSKPLDAFLPALEEVVFHSKLGSVAAKSRRIAEISEFICQKLNLDENSRANAIRAALLCKADLVSLMLGEKEFTKLQGYIGRHYALAANELPDVAEAIHEHYMPKGQADELPQTDCGAIVAIADKLDTVCGIIGIGLLPTGSGDPFALRRAANGIVQIICDRGWDLQLAELIDKSLEIYSDILQADTSAKVYGFFAGRTQWLLKQEGIDYDIIDSVTHIDISGLTKLLQRAKALQEIRQKPDFVRLVIGFKRVANILGMTQDLPMPDPKLFETEAENVLYNEILMRKEEISSLLNNADYIGVLHSLLLLADPIDAFFEKVLVNAEEEALRKNRYALLAIIRCEFLKVADLSKIVVENT